MSAITVFQPITKLHPQDKPLFSGKTAPEKSLNVCQSGTGRVLAKTTSDKNGSWLVRSSVSLPEGEYSISAYVEGTSVYADNVPFIVEALSSGALPSGSAPTVTSSTTVTTLRPLLEGKAAADTIAYVYQAGGSVLFGKTPADRNGDWALQLPQDLGVSASGTSELSLIAYNTAGAPVSGWRNVTLTVNVASGSTALPSGSAPTVTSSTTVTTLRPLLKGKAAADTIAYVYQAGGSVLFGKPPADQNGDWALQLPQDLGVSASGTSELSLIAYNTAGAPVSGWRNVTLTVNVASGSTALPSGSAPTVTSSTTVTTLRPLLKGKAAADTIAYVYQAGGSVLFGKPPADQNGDWALQLPQDLGVSASGTSELSLIAYNTAGAPVSGWRNVTLTVNVASGSTALPSGSAPTVTSSTTVTTLRPLLKGKAAADTIAYVYQAGGSVLFGKPPADQNGDWALQLPQDLGVSASGTSELSLIAYNAAGAPVSDWRNVTLTVSRP